MEHEGAGIAETVLRILSAGHQHGEVFDGRVPHPDVLCYGVIEEHHVLVDDGNRVCQFLV